MTYEIRVKYTRPNVNVKWFKHRASILAENTAKAKAEGDLLFQETWQDPHDPLKAEYCAMWKDKAAWVKWVGSNQIVAALNKMMDDYNERFGITAVRTDSEMA